MSETSHPAPAAPASPSAPPYAPRRWHVAALLGLLLVESGAAGVAAVVALQAAPAPDHGPGEKAPDAAKDTVTMSPEKQTAAAVETAPAAAAPLRASTWRTGRVALNEDHVAHISPPAEGIVREVPVRLGQTVAAGEVLAVIDCRELGFLKLELVKARAALATERDAAARARTTTTNAAELLKLLVADAPLADIEKKLADRPIGDWRGLLLGAYARRGQARTQLAALRASTGAVSESSILKAQSEADAAAAAYTGVVEDVRYQVTVQARQAELKLREADTAVAITKAKLMTFGLAAAAVEALDPLAEGAKASLMDVKAPFAGTVIEKHAVQSERVGPQFQMFVLSDLATVWVQADVYEADLPLTRGLAGRSVVFRSDAAGVAERPARVVYAGDLIDRASRTLTLTAQAPNPDRALKPGMMVEVGFDAGTAAPVVQVPAGAVLWHENQPFVFVARGGDTFVKRDVTRGRQTGNVVEIADGLRAGEPVVVRGMFELKSEFFKDQMAGK